MTRRGGIIAATYPKFVAAAATTTWDPANPLGANVTFSNGNLTATISSNTFYSGMRSVRSHVTSGKYYFETTIVAFGSDGQAIGICNASYNNSAPLAIDPGANSIAIRNNTGQVYCHNSSQGTVQTWTTGSVVCCALDLDNGKIWFRVGAANWNNSGTDDPATNTGGYSLATAGLNAGPYFAAATLEIANDSYTANFGATAYNQTKPTGFSDW